MCWSWFIAAFFQATIQVHMKHSSPTCSETELGDFSFLLVANGNFAEKKCWFYCLETVHKFGIH